MKLKFTYIIVDVTSSFVKIGMSREPQARLRSLRYAHGFGLQLRVVISGDYERRLQDNFTHLWVNGDWFNDPQGEIIQSVTHLTSVELNGVRFVTNDEVFVSWTTKAGPRDSLSVLGVISCGICAL